MRLDLRTASSRTNCTGDGVCSEGWASWKEKHILIPWVSQPSNECGFYSGCLMTNFWIHHLQWFYKEWKVRTESRQGYHSASVYQIHKPTNPPEVADVEELGQAGRTHKQQGRFLLSPTSASSDFFLCLGIQQLFKQALITILNWNSLAKYNSDLWRRLVGRQSPSLPRTRVFRK